MVLVHGHARRSAMAEYRESDLLTCGYYKIASTLPNVLRRLKPAPRAYWVLGVLWAARLDLCRVPSPVTTVAKQSTWHSDSSTSQPQRLRGLSLTTKARSETLQHRRIAPDSAVLLAYLLASFYTASVAA